MLQMEREQRETYRRETSTLPTAVASRLLHGASGSRNKQKRAAFQSIGGAPAFTCPQLESYTRALLNPPLASASVFGRSFPQAPERVLDAPGLLDDFYLNTLDWGKRNVLAVGLGPSVYLWNGRTGNVAELMSLASEASYITAIRWIHDGSSIAVGTSEGTVQIWDTEAGKKLRTIVASAGGHRIAAVAWNKHNLSTGSRDGKVGTNDVRMAKPLILQHQSHHQDQEVCGLEWSPDGAQLASGGNDNLVHVWDAGQAAARHVFAEHRSAVKALAWCPWKQGLLATGGGSQDRHVRTWNTLTGHCVSSTNTDSPVTALVWSRTSKELVSGHGAPNNAIKVWRVTSTSQSACHLVPAASHESPHAQRIIQTALSPDGQTLVTASADESIKFWRCFEDPKEGLGVAGGKKKGTAHGGQGGYVLMPKFSRSTAITKAMNAANTISSSMVM